MQNPWTGAGRLGNMPDPMRGGYTGGASMGGFGGWSGQGQGNIAPFGGAETNPWARGNVGGFGGGQTNPWTSAGGGQQGGWGAPQTMGGGPGIGAMGTGYLPGGGSWTGAPWGGGQQPGMIGGGRQVGGGFGGNVGYAAPGSPAAQRQMDQQWANQQKMQNNAMSMMPFFQQMGLDPSTTMKFMQGLSTGQGPWSNMGSIYGRMGTMFDPNR